MQRMRRGIAVCAPAASSGNSEARIVPIFCHACLFLLVESYSTLFERAVSVLRYARLTLHKKTATVSAGKDDYQTLPVYARQFLAYQIISLASHPKQETLTAHLWRGLLAAWTQTVCAGVKIDCSILSVRKKRCCTRSEHCCRPPFKGF